MLKGALSLLVGAGGGGAVLCVPSHDRDRSRGGAAATTEGLAVIEQGREGREKDELEERCERSGASKLRG